MVTEENVVIQAGQATLSILPQAGGKIASLRLNDIEFLQPPLRPIAPRSREMSFEDSDASGWDECFPSVAPCHLNTRSGHADVPDHGDLWRIPWTVTHADASAVTLSSTAFSIPLEFTRTLLLTEANGRLRLSLMYTIANRTSQPLPWAWSAHPLFLADPGDRIHLPASVTSLRVEGSGGNRLGVHGDSVSWPIAASGPGPGSGPDDLSLVRPITSGRADKLFTGHLSDEAEENWCALDRLSIGYRLTLRFQAATTPYLGLWLCYGGWPDNSANKQMCVALEPATAPVDSLAISGPWSRVLGPGQTVSWSMEVVIEPLAAETKAKTR